MKNRIIALLIVFVFLSSFVSCDTPKITDSEQSDFASSTSETTDSELDYIDYSKFVFNCEEGIEEFFDKYGTYYKKVESEEEFDEVLYYVFSCDPEPYVYIKLECNADKVFDICSDAEGYAVYEASKVGKDDDRLNMRIETRKEYFDADLIKEIARDNETVEIQFVIFKEVYA